MITTEHATIGPYTLGTDESGGWEIDTAYDTDVTIGFRSITSNEIEITTTSRRMNAAQLADFAEQVQHATDAANDFQEIIRAEEMADRAARNAALETYLHADGFVTTTNNDDRIIIETDEYRLAIWVNRGYYCMEAYSKDGLILEDETRIKMDTRGAKSALGAKILTFM